MDNTDTVGQIQEFVSTEFDFYGRTPEEQLNKSDITEENFLECIMNDYEYLDIQKRFKLTRNALNLWRKQQGFYGKTKKQLKEQYRSKFQSK